jgi:hypothetical protein
MPINNTCPIKYILNKQEIAIINLLLLSYYDKYNSKIFSILLTIKIPNNIKLILQIIHLPYMPINIY